MAQTLRATIPQPLRDAARPAEPALPLVFALVLNAEADVRTRQLAQIEARYDAGSRARVEALAQASADLHPIKR